jgi:hypothetical protein
METESLCEQCIHYDKKYSDICRQACEEAGIECNCIWCNVSDRLEPKHWKSCVNFKGCDNE